MRYILRMFGVPMEGPSYMYGDILAAVNSSMILDDTLKKRLKALSYHRVREVIAAEVIKFFYINGNKKPAGISTKALTQSKWYSLMKPILHWEDKDEYDN